MTNLLLRLTLRTWRWLAPALFLLVGTSLMLHGPGDRPALDFGAGLVPLCLIWAVWMTLTVGNLGDRPLRDVLASAAGSVARLHHYLILVMVCMGAGVSAMLAVSTGVKTGFADPIGSLWVFTIQMAVVLAGIAIGTFLHKPFVSNRGVAMLIAVAAIVGVLRLPVVGELLRRANRDDPSWVLPAFGVSLLAVLTAAAMSETLHARAAR